VIKTFTVTKEFQHSKRYCDFCSAEINTRYASSQCEHCRKDICPKCVAHEDDYGDHPDVWCKKCWDIGNEYRLKIEELKNQVEQLEKEWIDKCKT
jgi:hypothetical protein